MPTYDYKCSACGHTFEQFQSITAEPLKRCPQCGKAKVKRLIGTGAGLIFKGSGFYITDYRDAGYKEKAKAESGGGGESKGDSQGESKADGKAETKSSGADKAAASGTASDSGNAPTPKPQAKSSSAKPSTSKPQGKSGKKT